jgi:predicted DNA-binding protein with PD1-like motif
MRSHELTVGRHFGVTFDHGEDFFPALVEFCETKAIRSAYAPMFIAGFSEVDVVGSCEPLENPEEPVWSAVHLTCVEALGAGTIAVDENGQLSPHIHVSVGLKENGAAAHASHLLAASVQFLTELLIIEVRQPTMRRRRDPNLYDVPLLSFE